MLDILAKVMAIVLGCTTLFTTFWIFYKNREKEQKEKDREEQRRYTDSKAEIGKIWVDELKIQWEQDRKYNTQQFDAIKDRVEKLEGGHNTLNSQLMTEHKVDTKLQPIKDEVDETKVAMKDLRDEFRNHASLSEMNTQQLLAGMSEIKGYLKAKAEDTQ